MLGIGIFVLGAVVVGGLAGLAWSGSRIIG
jgi:hypothetical protein